MTCYARISQVCIGVAAILLLACAVAAQGVGSFPIVKLTCQEVMERGLGGHSFAVKEWTEPWPGLPHVYVVSENWLPVEPHWFVDITGRLRALTGIRKDGTTDERSTLFVSPEDVLVYCNRLTGEPCRISPMTGLDPSGIIKRPLTDFAATASTPGEMPSPGGSTPNVLTTENPESSVEVVPCSTIAAAKSQPLGTVVIIRCHPISTVGAGSFVMGEDSSADALAVYYTGTVNQTDRVCVVTGTIDTTDVTDRVLDVDFGPSYNAETSYQGSLLTAPEGSIAWVKTYADDVNTSRSLSGKIITRNWTDYFYIEDDSRACGIRVQQPNPMHVRGEIVSVVGTLATSNGERYIAAPTVANTGTGELGPLGLNNMCLGGGDFAYDTNYPDSGQRGITGASGLNNIGLLVKTSGKVTETAAEWFLIDDGSNVQTKVAYPPYGYVTGDNVAITGISSCEVDTSSDMQRVLRPQLLTCTIAQATGQNDITNTSPVNFAVIFSEQVTGFTDGDVTVNGITGATPTVTGSGATYNVAVSLPTAGTIVATVLSGVVQNSSGVWNYEATYTDNSVLYDNVIPTISACTVTPTLSSGEVTIGYTGASDTGGSGLYVVGLYAPDGYGSYYLLYDPATSQPYLSDQSSDTFNLDFSGNGTVDSLVLFAWDNALNYSVGTAVPPFTIDQTAPTDPATVVMDHVLPTSQILHGTWSASTDSGSGFKDYQYRFFYSDGGGEHALGSGWTTTTATQGQYTLTAYPSTTDGKTYYFKVKARDNALNESAETDSGAITCQKAKTGYLYYLGDNVYYVPGETDGMRSYIRYRMNAVASANAGIMQYTQLSSFPTSIGDYDVLMVSCPNPSVSLTTDQTNQIAGWANKWHRRLVLIGDSPFYHPSGQSTGYYSQRLNSLAESVSASIPPFKTSSGDIPSPYNIGTCTYFQYYRSWLLTGVTGLNYASPGYFNYDQYHQYSDWIARVDATYQWIIERDLSDGGMALCIHDMNVFDTTNTSSSHSSFVRNFCTKFE